MANTFYSDAGGLRFQPYARPEGAAISQPFSLTLTQNSANTDVYILGRIPAGATLMSYVIDVPDLDTHATPVLKIGIGDSSNSTLFSNTVILNTNTRFVSMGAVTNGAALTTAASLNTLPKSYANTDYLAATTMIAANTAGGNTHIIKGHYTYTMQPFFSDPKL